MVKVKVLFDFDNYRLEDLFGHKIMKICWVDMKIQWSLLTLTSAPVFVSYLSDHSSANIFETHTKVQHQTLNSQHRCHCCEILNFMQILVKGSSDDSHFIFENNVGHSRIRHRTILELDF